MYLILWYEFLILLAENEDEDKTSSESEIEDEHLEQTILDLEKAIDAFNDKKPVEEEQTVSRAKSLRKKKAIRKVRAAFLSVS